MIPIALQDALSRELKKLFSNETYLNQSNTYEGIKVFSQDLPAESNREDEENDPFPYIINRLVDGNVTDESSAHEVKLILIIGIYDQAQNKQGYRDVLHIIQTIYERFGKENVLDKRYVAKMPFKWTLQEEDSHPYYFGGIEMSFDIPAIRRENPFT